MAKKQKTALVTGGAKRIGAAISEDLAANGFNVAFQYTSSEKAAQEQVDRFKGFGVNAAAFEADLTEIPACKQLFEDASNALGTIDLLVNNASVFEPDSVEEFHEDAWDNHFALHVKAPAALSSAMAYQHDLESGLILNMIDQRVLRLNPNFFSYTLSKSTLWTATRTMAQSLAPRIRVNAIGPGPTLQNARQTPEDFQKQIDGLILKRGPELREFGQTIRHLYDTPSITGQLFALDGGQHLAWETPDIAGIDE